MLIIKEERKTDLTKRDALDLNGDSRKIQPTRSNGVSSSIGKIQSAFLRTICCTFAITIFAIAAVADTGSLTVTPGLVTLRSCCRTLLLGFQGVAG